MEVDLQSLFGLHVTLCAQLFSLAETPLLPPSPRIWTRITRARLVSKDKRHIFVTPCCKGNKEQCLQLLLAISGTEGRHRQLDGEHPLLLSSKPYTVKKRFANFPSPAGMSLPNSPWAGIMTS
jgi:hypothetical protein